MSINGEDLAAIKALLTEAATTEANFRQGLDHVIDEVESLNTAPPVATTGYEVFTSSGTWDYAAAGSPSKVFVTLVGGGASGSAYTYPNLVLYNGGSGGAIFWREVAVNSNETVTVGAAGGSPDGSYTQNSGGVSEFGPISVGGGAGGSGGTATGPGSVEGLGNLIATGYGTSYSYNSSPFGGVGSGGFGHQSDGAGKDGIVIVAY